MTLASWRRILHSTTKCFFKIIVTALPVLGVVCASANAQTTAFLGTAVDGKVEYGGSPYCSYNSTFSGTAISILIEQGTSIVDGQIVSSTRETPLDGCPYSPAPPSEIIFTLTSGSFDGAELKASFSSLNTGQTASFTGTKNENSILGTLTIMRSDLGATTLYFSLNVSARLYAVPINEVQRTGKKISSNEAFSLRKNVVRVVSSTMEVGFGLIVAENDHHLYVAAMRHEVLNADPSSPSPVIKVVFFSDQGASVEAEILNSDRTHDLALLRTRTPDGFSWEKSCLAPSDDNKRSTPVWYVGRDEKWYVPVLPGAISSDTPSANQFLDADIPNLRPGSSGAPLVTSNGIVGMVKAQSADDTRVLSIDFVRDQVKGWGYPWDLTVAPAASISK